MDFIENNSSLAVVDCGDWFYASYYVERTSPVAYSIQQNLEKNFQDLCDFAVNFNHQKILNSVYFIFKNNNQDEQKISDFLRERNIKIIHYV